MDISNIHEQMVGLSRGKRDPSQLEQALKNFSLVFTEGLVAELQVCEPTAAIGLFSNGGVIVAGFNYATPDGSEMDFHKLYRERTEIESEGGKLVGFFRPHNNDPHTTTRYSGGTDIVRGPGLPYVDELLSVFYDPMKSDVIATGTQTRDGGFDLRCFVPIFGDNNPMNFLTRGRIKKMKGLSGWPDKRQLSTLRDNVPHLMMVAEQAETGFNAGFVEVPYKVETVPYKR